MIARQVQAASNQMDQIMNQLYNLGKRINVLISTRFQTVTYSEPASEDRILADINTGSKLLDRQNGPNPRNLAAKALNCFLTTTLALQDFLIDY